MSKIKPRHIAEAERNGIKYRTLEKRVYDMKMPPDEACTMPLMRESANWDRWKDVAVVNYTTYAQRVYAGWREEDAALTDYLHKPSGWDEVKSKAAVGYQTFYNRLRSGWSVEDAAFKQKVRKKKEEQLQ
ncbi:hypothetical protein B0H94_11838 [Salsuginibacillus halophilus]|uniref:Uncharacterized protein n=1 Tax=Salsuginibacillus halophilus TaxID=517424 RepID=A0A2P8H658_9BACI|nr:hypothetical protein [Salsuginibacillus halophilus]PSL41725.1 hypothetical protein B0H94_11838 [Salsuginibacillus halophilus]